GGGKGGGGGGRKSRSGQGTASTATLITATSAVVTISLPSRGPNASLPTIPLGGKKQPGRGATPFCPCKRRAVTAGERWLAAAPPRPATGGPTGPVRRAGGPPPPHGGPPHLSE